MRLRITNLTGSPINTSLGSIAGLSTITSQLSPEQYHQAMQQLKALEDAGSISIEPDSVLDSSVGGRDFISGRSVRRYDIREFGARPGQLNKAVTSRAIQSILKRISNDTYFGGMNQGESAVIYFPVGDWWICEPLTYLGSLGQGVVFLGEHALARGGLQGSVLVYDGIAGGTLLECIGINGSEIKNLEFNGNGLARRLLWLHQASTGTYPSGVQVQPSSGVNVHSCTFNNPGNYSDSILVAAGEKVHSSNTYQSSEYRFFNCYFQGRDVGPGSLQGWGFRALDSGNTKNFVFQSCIFNTLYRGIECSSGYCLVSDCNSGNIGGYGRPGGAVLTVGGNTCTVLGGGLENGSPGYAARFLSGGQGTRLSMKGIYIAASPPADDYIVTAGSCSLSLIDCYFESNSRNTSTMIAWAGSTPYILDQEVQNGNNAYKVITAGTSATTGGPTGTANDITDGTVHWKYVSPADANILKIQASQAVNQDGANWGAVAIQNCVFVYNTARITAVPLYDGSNNHIGGGTGNVQLPNSDEAADFSRTLPVNVTLEGNSTGLGGGNLDQYLPNWKGGRPAYGMDQLFQNNAGYFHGEPYCSVLRNGGEIFILKLDYRAFKLNAQGTTEYRHCTLVDVPAKTAITGCWMQVDTLFAGPSSPLTIAIGTNSDIDALMTAVDVKTATLPIVYGRYPDNSCLGVMLDIMKDQPYGTVLDWTSTTSVYAALYADFFADLPSLSAGVVTIYLAYKRMA
jgi:hypothetical protein